LEEAELLIDDKKKLELAVEFGNKIPYKESIKLYGVGNSANVAVSGARLGLKTALYTFLGGDHYGEECIKSIQSNNVSTEYFNIYKNEKTNYHYVL
ncbi:MAG: PfkB family carbohydrate kinase, partial [Candidatus Pacebacteria bacterium]|nr:PfkB family carbohydrate kinase [Candidatus Paceibacterota bacterium]